MAGGQDEQWRGVIFLMSVNCLDFRAARLLHHYIFVLFDTSETSFVLISVVCAQKQFQKFIVDHS